MSLLSVIQSTLFTTLAHNIRITSRINIFSYTSKYCDREKFETHMFNNYHIILVPNSVGVRRASVGVVIIVLA